jgi:hypothetical protein
MAAPQPLTSEQEAAVVDFARRFGRTWKAALRTKWMYASAEPLLMQLRNSHGPDWLYRYRLPQAKGEER